MYFIPNAPMEKSKITNQGVVSVFWQNMKNHGKCKSSEVKRRSMASKFLKIIGSSSVWYGMSRRYILLQVTKYKFRFEVSVSATFTGLVWWTIYGALSCTFQKGLYLTYFWHVYLTDLCASSCRWRYRFWCILQARYLTETLIGSSIIVPQLEGIWAST